MGKTKERQLGPPKVGTQILGDLEVTMEAAKTAALSPSEQDRLHVYDLIVCQDL